MFIEDIVEESVQARTQMYDILSSLRRRGVTSGLVTFGRGSCEFMFWNGPRDRIPIHIREV